jgi:shikimate kinase
VPPRNLVLVGFMGSGKTTVGRGVAALLGLGFVDLDEAIAAEAGQAVAEIFRDRGEPAFRRLEATAVARVASRERQVIAPGGGAVVDDESWRALCDGNLVVWLRVAPAAALRRLRRAAPAAAGGGDLAARPLASPGRDSRRWPAAARRRLLALMLDREPRYAEADLSVDTTGREVAAVTREVAALARAHGLGGGVG